MVIAALQCGCVASNDNENVAVDARDLSAVVVEQESAAVYAALLNAKFIDDDTRQLVVYCKSYPLTRLDGLDLGSMWLEAAFADAQRSAECCMLPIAAPVPVTVIALADIEGYFHSRDLGWPAFYRDHPESQGVISLSPVGFGGPQRNYAVVHAFRTRGSLSGGGGVYVLEKRDGVWQVIKRATMEFA